MTAIFAVSIGCHPMLIELVKFWKNLPNASRGIIMMVASTALFSSMHAMIRYLSADMHPLQLAFFRNIFGLLVFLPIIVRQGSLIFRTEQLGLHCLRALCNLSSMMMFFVALSMAPIAKVTALAFTSPLFMALLSIFVLGERISVRRWTAIILGFIGVLIILRPGIKTIDLGSVLIIASSLTWAVTMLLIKLLLRKDSSVTGTAYTLSLIHI